MPAQHAITMPDSEQEQVEELRQLLQLGSPELVGPNGSGRVKLPPLIYTVLQNAVLSLQSGRTILLIPDDEEFTTETAANFLGVSRPHVIKLLESGKSRSIRPEAIGEFLLGI